MITQKQAKEICENLGTDYLIHKILGNGLHNENVLLKTGSANFVVRIENNEQFDNLEKEFNFLNETKGKYGPEVYLLDVSKKIVLRKYFVEEFIEGKHPNKIDNEFFKKLALWYKKLHKNKKDIKYFSSKEHYFDLNIVYEKIIQERYDNCKNNLNQEIQKEINELLKSAQKMIIKKQKYFSRIKKLTLNHNDPNKNNIFIQNNKLTFIDWEFVGYYIPEADLVAVINHYELTKEQEKTFLEAYKYPKSNIPRLEVGKLINLLIQLCWVIERKEMKNKDKIIREKVKLIKEQMKNL